MVGVNRRLVNLAAAVLVLAVFLAGLFVSGWPGGLLLVITDAVLITASWAVWDQVRPQGRPLRIAVIAVIAVVAGLKLVG